MVLRPLFWLSFTLDSYLAEAAIGLAHLLRGRGVPAVGLTSPRHAGFVKET